MKKQVDTHTIVIFGKQRSGKTLLSLLFAIDYMQNLISNFDIEIKNFGVVSKKFSKISQLLDYRNFKENGEPGLLIIDEVGLNFNSKDHVTIKNKIMSDFLFLQGKFNFSTLFIGQRFNSVPVDIRELASIIIEVDKISRPLDHPLFKCTFLKQKILSEGYELKQEKVLIIDIITLLEKFKISYNTNDTAIIQDDSKEFLESHGDFNKYRLNLLR